MNNASFLPLTGQEALVKEDIANKLERLADHPGSILLYQCKPVLRAAAAEIRRLRKEIEQAGLFMQARRGKS